MGLLMYLRQRTSVNGLQNPQRRLKSEDCSIDQEIQHWIEAVFILLWVSGEMGCMSILLYGCETWTINTSHLKHLESFHITS